METPTLQAPAGSCDCHIHVYDDRYALAPTATFKPPAAPVAAYREVQAALGLERVVVVQPSAYGFDNRCTLDAMAGFGAAARGVAVVPTDVSDEQLERLHDQGVRGIRYLMLMKPVMGWDSLETMAARIAPLGWHIDLQFDGREFAQREALLSRLPCDLVIDHNGKFLEPVGVDDPAFRSLLRLVGSGDVWVKLSAPYETSKAGAPGYDDVSALARALVKAHPARCLWASNWPHPNQDPAPSNAAMLDLLLRWADDQATRDSILVSNPALLYGF
ncbi:amidohydrolase family protein [Piscinibacter sp. XHJ-5]|uniref:amidohydrolase family protein n=1 Tax=Piscinibacter sp. XHJ-5 TaxID=3037797 RepID=UPI00245339D4|nr:amidohydrolase family protein [Piscinibacter sp. XHJ-5]